MHFPLLSLLSVSAHWAVESCLLSDKRCAWCAVWIWDHDLIIIISTLLLYSPAASGFLPWTVASPFGGFWTGYASTSDYFPSILLLWYRSCDDIHSSTQHALKEHLIWAGALTTEHGGITDTENRSLSSGKLPQRDETRALYTTSVGGEWWPFPNRYVPWNPWVWFYLKEEPLQV